MPADPAAFIARWTGIPDPAERANYQAFLIGLCDVLDVPHPDPAPAGGLGTYRFEREVEHVADDDTRTRRRMDLYRRDRFILEAKGAGKLLHDRGPLGSGSALLFYKYVRVRVLLSYRWSRAWADRKPRIRERESPAFG